VDHQGRRAREAELSNFRLYRRLKIFQSGRLLPLLVFVAAVFILLAFVTVQVLVYP
jgi:hypothetical protein